MDIRPLRTEADYEAALAAVAPYFDHEPAEGSVEADRFELLVMLIDAYESKHYAIDAPDPVEAIKFRMEQGGLSPKDLQPMIGQMNRVYEVLNYRRKLTLPMIRRLNDTLGIPADALIREPRRMEVRTSKRTPPAKGTGTPKTTPQANKATKASKPSSTTPRKTTQRKSTASR